MKLIPDHGSVWDNFVIFYRTYLKNKKKNTRTDDKVTRTISQAHLKATTLAGLVSRGSMPSSVTVASATGTYHFSSNVNLSLPDALYLAHAITSLNRKRCRSFL